MIRCSFQALFLASISLVLCHESVQAQSEPATTTPGWVGHYRNYAVAADHELASNAGASILAQGGTAADAAATTMLALGVVHPASSGLGGGGFALYYQASTGEVTFLDFRERAPAAITPDVFAHTDSPPTETHETHQMQPSQVGGLATAVPGEAAGIAALVERFGRLPLSRSAQPAIRIAMHGFEVSAALARTSSSLAASMREDPEFRHWFGDSGHLVEGELLRQPRLARTIWRFAQGGQAAFYRGPIARAIVRANRRAGGIMTLQDLAAYEVRERQPIRAERFGYQWISAPPPSAGGFTMMQSLALLERWVPEPERQHGAASSTWLHALAESWKGPFLDRQLYFGDPDHVSIELDAMRSEERLNQRASVFDPNHAMPAEHYRFPIHQAEPNIIQPEDGGTSHLCIVDGEGNVASITTTINLSFGARYTASGMVMNNEMDDFARSIGEANAFGLPGGAPNLPGPGRRPVSSMSPTLVFDHDQSVLCIGASGGSRIITATEQVALNVLILGMDPGSAVQQARIHHQGIPSTLRTETRVPLSDPILADLVARGHVQQPIDHVANVEMIYLDRSLENPLIAVSDPRKGGQPAGD